VYVFHNFWISENTGGDFDGDQEESDVHSWCQVSWVWSHGLDLGHWMIMPLNFIEFSDVVTLA